MNPTVESVFGPAPYYTSPAPGGSGPNGVKYSYQPYYFATALTAQKVAKQVGGKVVAMNAITPFGPFIQNMPNMMVQLPYDALGNTVDPQDQNAQPVLLNAGVIANLFSHGYPQAMIDQQIAGELGPGGEGFTWK